MTIMDCFGNFRELSFEEERINREQRLIAPTEGRMQNKTGRYQNREEQETEDTDYDKKQ